MASKGGSWRSLVVEEEFRGVRGGFRGREGEGKCCFMLLDVFVACKTHLGEIWLACSNFFASVKILYLILKMLY